MYYKFKKNITIVVSILMTLPGCSQSLKNTSYTNQSGEKALRIETTLPVDLTAAWKLFTDDERLKKWIAPLAHIE